MIRRLFWVALGFAGGVYTTLRAKRLLLSVTPKGIADRGAGLGQSVREFAGDVKVAMNARETELRDALMADAPPPAEQKDH